MNNFLEFLLWAETHKQLEKSKFNLLNISPFLTHQELENMHLHIENYILTHLQANTVKLYMIGKENSSKVDDNFIELYTNLRKKTDILNPFTAEMKKNMVNTLSNKTINKHWIFSRNELFLNRQYDINERMRKCKEEWKGVAGQDHFYALNQFSVLRRLNINNNPVVSILSALMKNVKVF